MLSLWGAVSTTQAGGSCPGRVPGSGSVGASISRKARYVASNFGFNGV